MSGDHTDNVLRATIKALDDVVKPAVDPSNALAVEQLNLVSAYLKLYLDRLPYLYDRNRFELEHYIELAGALMGHAQNAAGRVIVALQNALASGRDVLARPGARVPEIQRASEALAAAASALVRLSGDDADSRDAVEKTVLDLSLAYIDAQRSWFLPQGWEPSPSEVPPLEQALRLTCHDNNSATP